MILWLKKNRFHLLFVIAFITSAFFYDYFNIINEPANGIHVWRQTDGLSIAQKYFAEGNSLFEPEMHNRLSGEGKAVGEFPIMYYLVALLYHVFGVHFWVFRLTWMLTMFLGFFYLYRFCADFLNDNRWGILISLFAYTSPIVIIYGASFIIDPIALSFIYISWYFIYKYLKDRLMKHLLIAVLLVSFSGILKITSLISIISLIAVVAVVLLIRRIRWQVTTKQILVSAIPVVIIAGITAAWYMYASYYNEKHSTSYFFLRIAPIWELSSDEINQIGLSLKGWSREYLYESARHTIYVLVFLLLLPICNKHFKRSHYWFFLLSVIGFISFSLLFYSQFQFHDYYVVNLMFIIPLTVLFFVKKYQFILTRNKYIHIGFQTAFLFLLILSVIHGSRRAKERFAYDSNILIRELNEFKEQKHKYGIDADDLILVPSDDSPNASLFNLNMNGWSMINSIQYPEVFQEKIQEGAKWIFITDPRYYDIQVIEPYKDNFIVDYKGIRVYSTK